MAPSPAAILIVLVAAHCARCTTIDIQSSESVLTTIDSSYYLGYTIDTSTMRDTHFCGINWLYALNLARSIAPAYLRVGGNDCDWMTFVPYAVSAEKAEPEPREEEHRLVPQREHLQSCAVKEKRPACEQKIREYRAPPLAKKFEDAEGGWTPTALTYCNMFHTGPFNMSADQFDRVNWLTSSGGLRLIFDFNMETGTPVWDDTNTKRILEHADAMGYDMDFELGNEPDDWYGWFHKSISGVQMAKNYARLRATLDAVPRYRRSKLVGPAMGSGTRQLMDDFLKSGGAKYIDAATFHHYYGDGRTTDLAFFTNPGVMEGLRGYLKNAVKIVNKHKPAGSDKPEPWLAETATTYHGGTKDISNSYAAGFMWMDKLGMSAATGVKAVFRQTFFLGNYSLLDYATRPNPDYWLSLLYKRLVPNNVHRVTVSVSGDAGANATDYYRFYAHSDDGGRTVVYGMNLGRQAVAATFGSHRGGAEQFLLTAGEAGNLKSRTVRLNGQLLQFDGKRIGRIRGVQVAQPVSIPPMSFGFWVFGK